MTHIVSWNVCGWCEPTKIHATLEWSKQHKVTILLLQELHWEEKEDFRTSIIRKKGWHITYAGNSSNSGGVAIVALNPITKVRKDPSNTWIQGEVEELLLTSMYAPSDRIQRTYWIQEVIPLTKSSLIGGDLNTRTQTCDSTSNKEVTIDGIELAEQLRQNCLRDLFQEVGEGPRYTFYHRNQSTATRIDYFLCPEAWINRATKLTVGAAPLSDHMPLLLELAQEGISLGKDKWMLNREILTEEWTEQLDILIANRNITTWEEWHDLKKWIKQMARYEERRRKREHTQTRQEMQAALRWAMNNNNLTVIHDIQKDWKLIEEQQMKARLKHWTTKWQVEGEKMSKMLAQQVQQAHTKQGIKCLKEGSDLYHGMEAIQYATDWYRHLFKRKAEWNIKEAHNTFRTKWYPKKFKWNWNEQDIIDTALQLVGRLKKQKAAGIDGIPAELYQRCPALTCTLIKLWIANPMGWKPQEGVITLLFKKGTNKK